MRFGIGLLSRGLVGRVKRSDVGKSQRERSNYSLQASAARDDERAPPRSGHLLLRLDRLVVEDRQQAVVTPDRPSHTRLRPVSGPRSTALLGQMKPIGYGASAAAQTILSSVDLAGKLRIQMLAATVAALPTLPVVTTLSVYKPRLIIRTRCARRC